MGLKAQMAKHNESDAPDMGFVFRCITRGLSADAIFQIFLRNGKRPIIRAWGSNMTAAMFYVLELGG
jgi:hypothetical protein